MFRVNPSPLTPLDPYIVVRVKPLELDTFTVIEIDRDGYIVKERYTEI